jgi:hypothetical protein
MKTLRPFTDLIQEIEVDGQKFIPAAKIAALCYNYNEKTVKNKVRMWINESYDCALWYNFETKILAPKKHHCYFSISRNFDITTYMTIDNESLKSNVGMPASNQVKIVQLLIKWGFVPAES